MENLKSIISGAQIVVCTFIKMIPTARQWTRTQRMLAVLGILCIFLLFRCRITNDCPSFLYGVKLKMPKMSMGQPNRLQYLYIAGVEGVGHHAVSPAIVSIAQSCGRHVIYQSKFLRRGQLSGNTRTFGSVLKHAKETRFRSKNILFLEDSSFPNGYYDLEWVYDQVKAIPDINIKFLYLSRDFYRTVASHIEFDDTFNDHALVLYDFIWYIHQEYNRINNKEPDLWGQITYEWFTELKNCQNLVNTIAKFMDWDGCNIVKACDRMKTTLRPQKPKVVNETDMQYSKTFKAQLPIPYLNYSIVNSKHHHFKALI